MIKSFKIVKQLKNIDYKPNIIIKYLRNNLKKIYLIKFNLTNNFKIHFYTYNQNRKQTQTRCNKYKTT